MKPKLTIGIPSFNGERYLRETALSALTQLLEGDSRVEVLILDNGSEDGTYALAQSMIQDFPNLRLEHNPKTITFNENVDRVVEIAKGEYVWILADDDVLVPGSINRVLEALYAAQPSVLLTRFQVVDSELEPLTGNESQDADLYILDAAVQQVSLEEADVGYRVFTAHQDAIRSAGFEIFGLLSAIVVSRSLWLHESTTDDMGVGDGFNFLYKVPKLMMSGPTVLVETCEVLFRQYQKRWQKHFDYRHEIFIYFIVIPTVLRRLISVGFGESSVNAIWRRHLSNFVLHLGVARKKGFAFDNKMLRSLVKANWDRPIFWLQAPAILLPKSTVERLSIIYTSSSLSKVAKFLFH